MKFRRPSVSLGVAIIALVVAMSGSALAGGLITSSQIKDGTIQVRDLSPQAIQLPPRPAGPQGTGRPGRPTTATTATTASPGPPGPQGPAGPAGPMGPAGAMGPAGPPVPPVPKAPRVRRVPKARRAEPGPPVRDAGLNRPYVPQISRLRTHPIYPMLTSYKRAPPSVYLDFAIGGSGTFDLAIVTG